MNPFALPGPQFLGLYLALAIAVTCGLWWKRRQRELQATAVPRFDDPYQLAMLRKGSREVAGLAMLTLIDRKLIVPSGANHLMRASGVTPEHVDHPLEKAALEILESPESVAVVESGLKAHPVLDSYGERLVRSGLLPGPAQHRHRLALWIAGFGFLLVVAAVKVAMSLSRSRPVGFLIGSCVLCAVVTLKACFPRLTPAGDEAVAHMEELFSSLRRRIRWSADWREPNELMWFGAVFGLKKVPQSIMPISLRRFQKSPQSDGGGCGGGGCGGGCGGCG